MTLREFSIAAPLLALAIFFGVYPQALLNYMQPSVEQDGRRTDRLDEDERTGSRNSRRQRRKLDNHELNRNKKFSHRGHRDHREQFDVNQRF